MKAWNQEVLQSEIKVSISSENSAIIYHKNRPFSQWYRERDYLYLRHVFKYDEDFYVADKSI